MEDTLLMRIDWRLSDKRCRDADAETVEAIVDMAAITPDKIKHKPEKNGSGHAKAERQSGHSDGWCQRHRGSNSTPFCPTWSTRHRRADIQNEKGRAVAESIPLQICSYVQCDVSDENQVKTMVDWTVQKYGQLDVMFSNAGTVGNSGQKVLDLDLSEFDRVIRVNARGMAACVKHAARAMWWSCGLEGIICTGSIAASRGEARRTDYIMSKHAVLGLVRSASRQLGEYGSEVDN
ncbi:(+)-cis,trans-nepetalactol synthase neps1 [Datura stramonium]|uniref:(+)-cis,trans-nepetalactol synthase neps1 n=1 Tax=Datura stramonium TaxID=4076 RepID=A0ABS8WPR5_DATST|nr:(+)-cis,trans-nepetalactol synthase neps1 [Datura stramonium]